VLLLITVVSSGRQWPLALTVTLLAVSLVALLAAFVLVFRGYRADRAASAHGPDAA